jgi:hypothetical protein
MRTHPISAPMLARVGATAGALLASASLATWGRYAFTYALTAGALGLSALLLHLRHTAAQICARAIWIASGILATLSLLLDPTEERATAALLLAGSAMATLLLGRSGLLSGMPDPFQPARYRAALLLALLLTAAAALGFAFFGALRLESEGSVTTNLFFAAALALGIGGLLRMRTWGLLLLAGMHAWIAGAAFLRDLPVFYLLHTLYGVSSLAALVGLSPMLLLAAKRVLRGEVTRKPAGARLGAVVPRARVAPLQCEVREALAEVAADHAGLMEATLGRTPRA